MSTPQRFIAIDLMDQLLWLELDTNSSIKSINALIEIRRKLVVWATAKWAVGLDDYHIRNTTGDHHAEVSCLQAASRIQISHSGDRSY